MYIFEKSRSPTTESSGLVWESLRMKPRSCRARRCLCTPLSEAIPKCLAISSSVGPYPYSSRYSWRKVKISFCRFVIDIGIILVKKRCIVKGKSEQKVK